ncbi:phospholipid carrier-dependent glycosyltransferase [soil metagenome]
MTPEASASHRQLPPNRRAGRIALVSCVALLASFYALGWFSVVTHSATIDEPLHASCAFLQTFHHDFRIDPEDPPLWKYWAMLPHHAESLRTPPSIDTPDPAADESTRAYLQGVGWLFQTEGNDGAAFINSSRAMMLIIGCGLGAVIVAWSWRLAGPVAAVVACVLFVFDPNFVAHAPLVKNDVSLSLVLFALAFAAWSVGNRARWWNVLLVAVLCGAAVTVKFSGVLAGPILALMLAARVLLPGDWIVLGRRLIGRPQRALAGATICVIAAVASFIITWASYGFQFEPTRPTGNLLNLERQIDELKQQNFYVSHNHRWPGDDELRAMPDPLIARAARFAQDHRLLPQPWIYGFLFTYRSTLMRPTFVLGERGNFGHWYYFPVAMLVKTPLATLAAMLATLALLTSSKLRRFPAWNAACIAIPVFVYGLSALTTNLNLGVRHVLPLYPFIYMAIGVMATRAQMIEPRWFIRIAGVLTIALAIETLLAFPHYISFFSAPARPHRLYLLSDSNFDWGQELTYVAEWQQRHPGTRLYLGYMGGVDPEFYGIEYINIPGGFMINPRWQWPPTAPGVVAISATLLQGVNCPPSCVKFYEPFRARKPREMIGDTIYVFDWPLQP